LKITNSIKFQQFCDSFLDFQKNNSIKFEEFCDSFLDFQKKKSIKFEQFYEILHVLKITTSIKFEHDLNWVEFDRTIKRKFEIKKGWSFLNLNRVKIEKDFQNVFAWYHKAQAQNKSFEKNCFFFILWWLVR